MGHFEFRHLLEESEVKLLAPIMEFIDELLFAFDFRLAMNANVRVFLSADGLFDVGLYGTPDEPVLALLILLSEFFDHSFEHLVLFLCMKGLLLKRLSSFYSLSQSSCVRSIML